MYSNKENVNILTSLLEGYGVKHAVVCPGSRNAPLVHNLNEYPSMVCHAVTDERSAGFCALGMAQMLGEPVAVCVTSGTALLNLAPAVAEARYQQVPLVVISADRPPQWIDQLDGQTLPQPDALGRLVKRAVTLPEIDGSMQGEPSLSEQRWYCRRLVCEALIEATHHGCGPVHINVPISEPLFQFTVSELPWPSSISLLCGNHDRTWLHDEVVDGLFRAERPLMVLGQRACGELPDEACMERIARQFVVLREPLFRMQGEGAAVHFDEALHRIGHAADYQPDYVLYLGGTLVSKRLKKFLRQVPDDCMVVRVSEEGAVSDPFMHLSAVAECAPIELLRAIAEACDRDVFAYERYHLHLPMDGSRPFYERWQQLLAECAQRAHDYAPAYSQMAVVRCLEQRLQQEGAAIERHYANSTAIRLANIYARRSVWCNRGVNGIEGSLSAAVGCSLVTQKIVVCVIGDLSFFYDQNALWNQNIGSNLRILLLNNHGGGIFRMLPGLKASAACDALVAGAHTTTARGICEQNHVDYEMVGTSSALAEGIEWLLSPDAGRPRLLEVVTDGAEDERVYRDYYSYQKNEKQI